MKKRTLMAIFAALTMSATMVAATSCDMLANIPIIGSFFGSTVEEKLPHAITWTYDPEVVTVTPVGADALPTQLMEGEEFSFTLTVKEGYTLGNVINAEEQADGSYKLTMAKRDITVSIKANKILNDIVVEVLPETLTFFEDQMVDKSLLKVTAQYELGDEVVTDYTIGYTSGYAFALGDTSFTVNFGGKSKTVELTSPVTAAQEFYDAELVVENDVVYIVAKGHYNAEGTVEEATETVEGWFNDCTERGSWIGMNYTVDVEMSEDKFFTVKLSVEGMTAGRQYYFHIKEGADGQDFSCGYKEGFVGVTGTKDNSNYTAEIPEDATYVETSDGTRYYLGTIPDWGSNPLILCPINENAPQFTGLGLELVEGKPYAVVSGTCNTGMEDGAAETVILNLIKHFDFEDIKHGNVKLNGDENYIDENAFVAKNETAFIEYDATAGTFKIYALLEGSNVIDGAAFFGHYGLKDANGYYTNVAFAPDGTTITANGFVFAFATAEELGLTEEWQAGITYISVTAVTAE